MLKSKLYVEDLEKIHNTIKNINFLNQCSILVTGSTGLIGSAVVDYLIYLAEYKNYNIKTTCAARNIDSIKKRFGEFLDRGVISFLKYNAVESLEIEGLFDYIIHAASPANPAEYIKHPVETMQANFIGLDSLLKYAKSNNVKKLLYISSSEVYGLKDNEKPYGENEFGYLDILNDRACYPSGKRAAETLCIAYANEFNVNVSIVRPGHIYGPTATLKDNRASSQFFNDVVNGNDIIMKSRGEQIRSYCYVLDCVSSIFTVLINGENKRAYNISNSDSICSIFELAQSIANQSGHKIIFDSATEKEKNSYNLMKNSSLDNHRICGLGWRGLFDLNKGVNHTLKIIKEIEGKDDW